ncbi:flagellar hook-length control protein FliK [Alicyclobacillus fastidiosus]|uniref:Flagellar hook-length control protein FliK n=1 Tax=Alicyclobacillus fastidiosus TaxID=392011 RepID=A0ABV5AIC8_9BACL|nr:flagellar hook-length control protein FliK [Alicyclobacillus fastidiosus]WEH07924.1 flagellar hook-length control protein FliK [Alicyclobacillus fastidiosus]
MQVLRKGAASAPIASGGVPGASDSQNGAVFDDLLLAMLGTNGTAALQTVADKAGASEQSKGGVAPAASLTTTAGHGSKGLHPVGGSTATKLAAVGGDKMTTAESDAANGVDLASAKRLDASTDDDSEVASALADAVKKSQAVGLGARVAKPLTDVSLSSSTDQNASSSASTSDSAGLATSDLRVATLLSKANHTTHRGSSTDSETSGASDKAQPLSSATGADAQFAAVTAGTVETKAPVSSEQASGAAQVDVRQPDALSQFGQLISVKAAADNSKLQVQILPQGMGQLDVTVTKGADGLQIQVVASQAATFAWLNQQMPSLQQNLQDLGLNVANFQLSYGQSDAQTGGGGQRQQEPSPERSASSSDSSGGAMTVNEAVAASPVQHGGDISLSI